MGSIIAWFAAQGLSARAAKVAAWVAAGLAVLAILGALAGVWRVFDWFNDRDAVEQAVNRANVETLEEARAADDAAARQAAEDDILLDRQLQETINAIDNAKDDGPGAAAVAHACQRLRRHGFAEADLPAECGPAPAAGR